MAGFYEKLVLSYIIEDVWIITAGDLFIDGNKLIAFIS